MEPRKKVVIKFILLGIVLDLIGIVLIPSILNPGSTYIPVFGIVVLLPICVIFTLLGLTVPLKKE